MPRPNIPFTEKEFPKVVPAAVGKVLLPYFLYKEYEKERDALKALRQNVPLIASIVGGVGGGLLGTSLTRTGMEHYGVDLPSPVSSMPQLSNIGAAGAGGLLGATLGSVGYGLLAKHLVNKMMPKPVVKDEDQIIFV